MSDQFAAWRRALKGYPMDCGPRGHPSSGYFMRVTPNGREAVGIWLDPDKEGNYLLWRSLTLTNPSELDGQGADEVLATCSRYPIGYDAFISICFENCQWPQEYETRLTIREIQEGVCWTPELGRQKLEAEWRSFERGSKWPEPKLPL
jgi:hypothetical protein